MIRFIFRHRRLRITMYELTIQSILLRPSLYRQHHCLCCTLFYALEKDRKKLEFTFYIKLNINPSIMGDKKECLRYFAVVFIPLVIFCMSGVAAWRSERNALVPRITRDLAQVMYLLITFIGLTNFSTNVKLIGDNTYSVNFVHVFCSLAFYSFSLLLVNKHVFMPLLIISSIKSS